MTEARPGLVLAPCIAGVAQLVEHHLAKVDVESSSLFARSILETLGKPGVSAFTASTQRPDRAACGGRDAHWEKAPPARLWRSQACPLTPPCGSEPSIARGVVPVVPAGSREPHSSPLGLGRTSRSRASVRSFLASGGERASSPSEADTLVGRCSVLRHGEINTRAPLAA